MEPLVVMSGLIRSFTGRGGFLRREKQMRAVDDVSLSIPKGQTLGLVGESGCGKSTLARMAVGLLEPDAGDVRIMGKSLFNKAEHDKYALFRREMCRHVQMIFQDPYSSLNPRMRIVESVEEPLLCAAGMHDVRKRRERSLSMLHRVGIEPGQANRYPHEFSGGQRQRIAIARALVSEPAFVVCDEPTSSLDASVQAQILNLLADLQEEFSLTYLFISHDLAVVRHMSDRVAVMYGGMIVEEADSEVLFAAPLHPYTRLLLAAVSEEESDGEEIHEVAVTPETTAEGGCLFAARCPAVQTQCHNVVPALAVVQKEDAGAMPRANDHAVRCGVCINA